MLPSVPLSPPDLHAAIAETRRASGAGGVVDLLTSVLAGARVRHDRDIDEFLPLLKSACRQTGRYREAVPVLRRIAELNPDRRQEVAAELALVHAHLREPAKGLSLLRSALTRQQRLPEERRSLEFFVVAEVAAVVLGRADLAREIALAGRHAVPTPARPRPEAVPATAKRADAVPATAKRAEAVPAAAARPAARRPEPTRSSAARGAEAPIERPVQLVVARAVRERELVLLRTHRRHQTRSPAFLRHLSHRPGTPFLAVAAGTAAAAAS